MGKIYGRNNNVLLIYFYILVFGILIINYTIKSKIGGSSQEELYHTYKTFHNSALENLEIPGITIGRGVDPGGGGGRKY